jgi:hypothetical protein
MPRTRGLLLRLALVLLAVAPAQGTTIIRGTFSEIVAEAEIAFEGVVIEVKSREIPPDLIVTDVRFNVVRAIKGDPSGQVTLTFAGGTVGNRTVDFSDMPAFAPGQRDIILAAPGRREISPLVRFAQGRFRIVRDAQLGRDVLRQFDGTILGSPAHVAQPSRAVGILGFAAPMSPSEFASAMAAEVVRQRGVPR